MNKMSKATTNAGERYRATALKYGLRALMEPGPVQGLFNLPTWLCSP